jgi:hypothetical protein
MEGKGKLARVQGIIWLLEVRILGCFCLPPYDAILERLLQPRSFAKLFISLQMTDDRRQKTGDRRQETGDRRQETGQNRGLSLRYLVPCLVLLLGPAWSETITNNGS